MFRSGQFVADQLGSVTDAQIQPNGVDLTLEAILEQTTAGRIGREGTTIGERTAIDPDDGVYRLAPGAYVAQYAEMVSVPEEHIGFILPRSSLMRNSCMLHTAVWDAGYEGKGEGLLTVGHPIDIEAGAQIGQFVLASADHEGLYQGSYQHERL
ncbi:MAG: deoxyuridine 5'-triphosphate nucleotidohydrolase [Salinarchaeum sp.]